MQGTTIQNIGLVVWISHSSHHWHFESLNGIGRRTLDMGELLESCFGGVTPFSSKALTLLLD